jgi:hypothetical protein
MAGPASRLSLISGTIAGKPYVAQIAKDNRWEDCWIINLDKNVPGKTELSDYLGKSPFSSLAIELLFKNTRNQTTIFGVIHNASLNKKAPLDFLSAILELSLGAPSFSALISQLEKEVIGRRYLLFASSPDLIRIGVVNHWFSIGPIDIWKAPSPPQLSREELLSLLGKKPEVDSSARNYQGVSFIYNTNPLGLYYWIKPQCGSPEGRIWRVDTEIVLEYLTRIFGFSAS